MTTFGNIHNISKEYEWRIDDFFSRTEKYCRSPSFSFANESWYIDLYTNGYTDSVGYISMFLYRCKSGSPIHLASTLSLKTLDGKKDGEVTFTPVYEKDVGYGPPKFMLRSTLLEKKAQLVPSDTLTVVCILEHYPKSPDDSGNTIKCPHCKRFFGDTIFKYLSSHELKCLNKPLRCQTCKDTVVLRDWFHHECDTARVKATEKLIDDLENLFENDEHSDVIVKVKDEEFHLHRNILAGRSPYFRSMFKSGMSETATGIVTIDDCEVDIFRTFAFFLYTGKVDEMNVENVCDLYEVADKYQEDQLKEECLCFMKNKMSIESFCDFIVLALKYGDKNLLQCATDLFCKHTKEIIQSVKWQTFMSKYSTQANELYMKAFDSNCK